MGEAVEKMEQPAPLAPASPLVTPMEMISRALAQNASIEVLERLMALQERREKHEARIAFETAMAAAKALIKPVVRNSEGHNNKRYADFSALAMAVDPILSEHGLSYRFRTKQDDRIQVTCILSHCGGHSEETTLAGPPDKTGSKNDIQAIGSTLTYLQRYSLMQAIGVAAAKDDDGRGAGRASGPISSDQVSKVRKLIMDAAPKDSRNAIEVFLGWVRTAHPEVEKIEDIPASAYAKVVSGLEDKIKHKGKKS